jgi:Ca2+/Na+ antiporter
MKAEENGRDPFCKETEERTMEFFSFSAKVFRWCRILMIPAAAIYAAAMIYAQSSGRNPAGSFLFLLCLLSFIVTLLKLEKEYGQYVEESRAAIIQGSPEPYSQKALKLRGTQQKAGKGVYFLIAGMVIALGLLCLAGGAAIMLMGGSWIFWGFPILVLSLPCFLLGIVYIGMGRTAPE